MNSYYSREELLSLGLGAVGEDVQISRKACLYGRDRIRLGNHVRIDDYAFLSGTVTTGDYVHIAPFVLLYGGEKGIEMGDFSTLSSRCAVYAFSDDYSGAYMTNPTVPEVFLHVCAQKVAIGRHVVVGTGTTILPGASIGDGAAVGAMSLVKESLPSGGIYCGIPCRLLRKRQDGFLCMEPIVRMGGAALDKGTSPWLDRDKPLSSKGRWAA